MSLAEHEIGEIHPIDIVETLAEHNSWEFDRVAEDQIAMAVEGQWRTYALTLAWSGRDEMLRLIVSFEMEPPQERLAETYELFNLINDICWAGAFTYWRDKGMVVYRYGLLLSGGQMAGPEQIDAMIAAAVRASERFYPAMQLVAWANATPKAALDVAIAEAYGRA